MDIFNYLDYRKYLADALKERKEQNYHFSFRFIAQHLNLSSPGFFNWVISGKRKLPEALIPKIAILFKLNDKECAYLHLLVRYTHSEDAAEREELFEKLSVYIKKRTKKELPPAQYQLFSKWYYLAIRELLRAFRFRSDYKALANALHPRIKVGEAREAVEVLERIGLIKPDEQGYYHPVEALLTTGEVWESDLITTLQTSLAELGKKSILSVDKKDRDISNLTVCISVETRKRISAELAALRQKILTLSENDTDADRVYQCNIQLFPVSQKVKVEK
ncbi:MAG: TIGR02147 family protein [Chitinispirillaceae bacterium]|nr:TIGR02147 family protein [Chitinispirillaceae bacterium]